MRGSTLFRERILSTLFHLTVESRRYVIAFHNRLKGALQKHLLIITFSQGDIL